jgi:hypothetical protein
MAKRMELALSILVLFLLVGCAGSPTATPGLGGTEVAVQEAAAATLTAGAPTTAPTSPAAKATLADTATPISPPVTATSEVTGSPAPSRTSGSAPGPTILTFQILPTVTANVGDVLTMSWQATGDRAEICPVGPTGPAEDRCRDVALSGSTQWTTDEEAMAYTGFALRAWAGTANTLSVIDVKLQCQNLRQWFFSDPPQNCPVEQATTSDAAGQYFEHGFMIWTEEPDTFYVFYARQDEEGFQTFDAVLDPGSMLKPGASPDNRVGEQSPAGLLEPVSGFGMVWRGEIKGIRADVRERLGWATEPEFAFDSAHQCMTLSLPHYWVCFQRGPRGEILRLHPDSTAQVRLVWEEW